MNITFAHRAKIALQMLLKGGLSGSWLTIGSGSDSSLGHYSASIGAEAQRKSAILAMCILRWNIEYPQIFFNLYDNTGKPQPDHDFINRITKPNAAMDLSELLTLVAYYRLMTGTALIHILRNDMGIFIGMEPRHAFELTKEFSPSGELTNWVYTDARGVRSPIPMSDVIALPWPVRDPSDTSLGLSPLHSVWTEHSTYTKINDYVYQFLSNGAVPGLVLSTKEPLAGTEEDKKLVRAEFERKYGLQSGGVGKSLFIDGSEISVQKIGTNLKELALDGLRSTPEANICGAFAVPPELVGAQVGLTNSTYSNKREARRGFVENTLVPMWEQDASRLSRILESEYKLTGWYLQPDYSRVAALKEDEEKRNTRALAGFTGNVLTRDEARGILGQEPVDNAPVFSIDLQQTAMPVGKNYSEKNAASKHHLKADVDYDALWKSLDEDKLTHVERLMKKLDKQAKILADSVLASAKSTGGFKSIPKMPTDAELKRIFEDGTEEERKQLVEAMLKRATKDADFNWDDVVGWLDSAEKDAAKASAEGLSDSYGNLKDELKELITENASASLDELKDALGTWVKNYQAMRIAQTTVTKTTTVAQQEAWKSFNKRRNDGKTIEQMWLSERDNKVRPMHVMRDGMQREIGKDFDGSPGPGLSGIPEDDINCRCVLIPVTVKKGN